MASQATRKLPAVPGKSETITMQVEPGVDSPSTIVRLRVRPEHRNLARTASALSDTDNLSTLLDQQEQLKGKVTVAERGLRVDTHSLKDSL